MTFTVRPTPKISPSHIDDGPNYKNFRQSDAYTGLLQEAANLRTELAILKAYTHSLLVRLKVDERFVEDVVDIHIANRLKETKV